MSSIRTLSSSVLFGLLLASPLFASVYKVDPTHSNIGFSVRHMFSDIKGQFKAYDGSFDFDEKSQDIKDIAFTIKANSLDTNNVKRDEHLNSPDFFDSVQFTDIQFKAEKITRTRRGDYKISGPLTLHGVTKPVTFSAKFLGSGKNPWGQSVASFTANTIIQRKDFGMQWNKALDNGGVLIGNDVTISVEIEAAQQK